MAFAQEYEATQTLLFYGTNEALRIRVALWNSGRTKNDLHAAGFKSMPKTLTVLGIAVDDEVGFAQREAIHGVDELTSDLSHPCRVGGHRRAAHLDGARAQIDDEQREKGDQSIPGHDLGREKVSRDQGFPMGLHKPGPAGGLAADRSRIKTVAAADVVDGRIAHLESEIVQGTRDAFAAPGWVFLDQFDDEFFKCQIHARSTDWIGPGKGPLLGDRDTEPTEEGVGRDERGQLAKAAPAHEFGFARKPNPLGLREPSGFAADLFEENAIFFLEVFDHGLLMSVHPAGNGDEEELELSWHGVENHSKAPTAQSPKWPRLRFLVVQDRLADTVAAGEHARVCSAPAAVLAVSGPHAAGLRAADPGGKDLVRWPLWRMMQFVRHDRNWEMQSTAITRIAAA